MFEEIRRLRLERGRLLQKIKTLEQQQQSALSALEEVLHCQQLQNFMHVSFNVSWYHVSLHFKSVCVPETASCLCRPKLLSRCHHFYTYICSAVVWAEAASSRGRGRQRQVAWGAERRPWHWSEWLWRHGWNVGLSRYVIYLSPHPLHVEEHVCLYVPYSVPLPSGRI